ncbi:6-bladed beta-propeller [Algoriphagus halophytocola]|uniref:6-bladed beta-propeller n=1 Tax=Algoriphagus halophytocola TaxID=2991499 RepID=A0ABY6MG88_9BACT|nr:MULTISPECIES: 6-bladed beta-propeller [unclassified Algoriphagus]UZD22653.1 6-bladed beta-propeller [Algoriphagus sp. TR-M5]WBL43918.1 6-bladed beta-propeller [Algoriphagus sp. TR-M9]
MKNDRRSFIKQSSLLGLAMSISPSFSFASKSDLLLGHGDFQYKIDPKWGMLDPAQVPVNNCHEMVMDRRGRMIMVTDEPKNNVIIYQQSGKLLKTWTLGMDRAHGLTLVDEGDAEYLWVSDNAGRVVKTTLDGKIVSEISSPIQEGIYTDKMPFVPTETTVAPNGDLYVADGYGSQFFLQYDKDGNFIRKFGGKGSADEQFSTAHGITVDQRGGKEATLLCTSRGHNSFKRFSMEGAYLETIFLPGAFVCRPVIHGDQLYAGVCWSRLRYLEQTPDSGFVTILNEANQVVSNPGGTAPEYRNGELQLMVQSEPIFKHCHDVCIDQDENIYVCQWNAGKTYPIKLIRT